jgi:hypothetical protein
MASLSASTNVNSEVSFACRKVACTLSQPRMSSSRAPPSLASQAEQPVQTGRVDEPQAPEIDEHLAARARILPR